MTPPMNMPYISFETVFKAIDEVAIEYNTMAKEGKHGDERQVGRAGMTASLKIKKSILAEIKKRERNFD